MKILEIFLTFLRLGMTSFGGPVAHLGYFHNEFVKRRNWLSEQAYVDLVALCQFLPGPASSQVGIAIGLTRGGVLGAIAAWLGFTLPSAVLMVAFALGLARFSNHFGIAALHGLKIAAVAIVAQAIWSMGRKFSNNWEKASVTLLSAMLMMWLPLSVGQIAIMLVAGFVGLLIFRPEAPHSHTAIESPIGKKTATILLILFCALLLLLPAFTHVYNLQALHLFDRFFRTGSMVFGGGHVVLPLLKAQVVDPGWVSADTFMAGYGAAQAIPGPLFTFSAYLGAVSALPPNGWEGAILCLVAAFLPSFFLVFGAFPFWEEMRKNTRIRAALAGTNAAVVGLLLAAFINPVWTSSILSAKDFAIALLAFFLLVFWQMPSWAIVGLTAFATVWI